MVPGYKAGQSRSTVDEAFASENLTLPARYSESGARIRLVLGYPYYTTRLLRLARPLPEGRGVGMVQEFLFDHLNRFTRVLFCTDISDQDAIAVRKNGRGSWDKHTWPRYRFDIGPVQSPRSSMKHQPLHWEWVLVATSLNGD